MERIVDAVAVKLLEGRDPPAGFDAGDLAAATRSLALKRLRELRLSWPELCHHIQPQLESFVAYATRRPPPAGGVLGEGLAFAEHLRLRGELPEPAKIALLTLRVRWRIKGDHAVRRRVPAVRLAAFDKPPRLVTVLRLPQLGERRLELRLPWTQTYLQPGTQAHGGDPGQQSGAATLEGDR